MFQKKEKKQVLLVDNFDQVREVTKSILEGAGYAVSAASNIGDALKLLSKRKPDLIVSEIELPGIGGIGLYNRLKKESSTSTIPFLFFTNYEVSKIEPRLQKYEDMILSKSTPWKEVVSQVETFLRSRDAAQKKKKMTKPTADKKDALPKSPEGSAVPQTPTKAAASEKARLGPKTAVLEKPPLSKKTAMLEKKEGTKKQEGSTVTAEKVKKPETQAVPKEIKIDEMSLESKESGSKLVRKKKQIPIQAALPPGHSTRHFSIPSSIFDGKNMGDLASSLFTQCKRGRIGKEEALQFQPLQIPTEGLREKLQQMRLEQARKEAELLEDLVLEEEEALISHPSGSHAPYHIEDEDILMEMDESFEQDSLETIKEDTGAWEGLAPTAFEGEKLEETMPSSAKERAALPEESPLEPLAETRKLFAESFPQYAFSPGPLECTTVPTEPQEGEDLQAQQASLAEICHDLISFSGLCLQVFNQDFTVVSLAVDTEEKNIFLLPKDERGIFFAVVPKKQ